MQRDAEIAQLQNSARGDEYVARRDIAMHGARRMQQRDHSQQSDNLAASLRFRPRPRIPLQISVEIATLDQLRDQAIERLPFAALWHPRE